MKKGIKKPVAAAEITEKEKEAESVKKYLKGYKNAEHKAAAYKSETETEQQLLKTLLIDMPPRLQKINNDRIKQIEKHINALWQREKVEREKSKAFKSIIDAVPGAEGELLHKRYIDCLTWDEIAQQLYCSVSNVHYIHNRAINEAAEVIKAQGIDLNASSPDKS